MANTEQFLSGTVPRKGDTIRMLLVKEVKATIAGGGGGGGVSNIMAYTTTDPNTDGITPTDATKPAIAVKPASSIYTWTVPAGPWV